jgi:hypothetical protein
MTVLSLPVGPTRRADKIHSPVTMRPRAGTSGSRRRPAWDIICPAMMLLRAGCAAFVLGLVAVGHAHVAPAQDGHAKLTQDLPRDAAAVVKRRVYCNHWSGEAPYDAARAREITRNVLKLRCSTLERDETRLRGRYAGNARVLSALDDAQNFYP